MSRLRSIAVAALSIDYLLLGTLLVILAVATLQMLGGDTFRFIPAT